MTPRDLIAASLRKIGAIASGDALDAVDAEDGLAELNRMLGSWSNESLLIYQFTPEPEIPLIAGQSTYTLGTGGDLDTRPQRIAAAAIRDSSNLDFPLNVRLSLDEFNAITLKSVSSPYPTDLYDDGGFPQRTVTLYPAPSSPYSLLLYTLRPLASIATLDTQISLPPGYDDALVYNLSVRLAPEYGKAIGPLIMQIAIDTKAHIKRANHRPRYLRVDPALLSGRGGAFDIYTGRLRR